MIKLKNYRVANKKSKLSTIMMRNKIVKSPIVILEMTIVRMYIERRLSLE